MNKNNLAFTVIITSLLAVGANTLTITSVQASDKEKCYGVVKAGKNDCATASSSCAGTASKDSQKDAFIVVPRGLCTRLVGGSTSS